MPITCEQIGDRSNCETVQLAENGERETFIFRSNENKGDASENEQEREACIGEYLFHNVLFFVG